MSEGLTSIMTNNRWFDVLYVDRGADVTFVSFHAALSTKITDYPIFSGHKMSEGLDANFLGFADPVCGSVESLATGWHLGSKRVYAQRFIPAIVRHTLASGPGKHLIFFWLFGGGLRGTELQRALPRFRGSRRESPYRSFRDAKK